MNIRWASVGQFDAAGALILVLCVVSFRIGGSSWGPVGFLFVLCASSFCLGGSFFGSLMVLSRYSVCVILASVCNLDAPAGLLWFLCGSSFGVGGSSLCP